MKRCTCPRGTCAGISSASLISGTGTHLSARTTVFGRVISQHFRSASALPWRYKQITRASFRTAAVWLSRCSVRTRRRPLQSTFPRPGSYFEKRICPTLTCGVVVFSLVSAPASLLLLAPLLHHLSLTNQLSSTKCHQPFVTNQLSPTNCHQPIATNDLLATCLLQGVGCTPRCWPVLCCWVSAAVPL